MEIIDHSLIYESLPNSRTNNPPNPISIRFLNTASFTIDLYWKSYTGEVKFYNTIPQGQHRHQPTFSLHSWIIVNAETNKIHTVIVSPNESTFLSIFETPTTTFKAPTVDAKLLTEGPIPLMISTNAIGHPDGLVVSNLLTPALTVHNPTTFPKTEEPNVTPITTEKVEYVSSTSTIAGCALGGAVFLVLIVAGVLLIRKWKKSKKPKRKTTSIKMEARGPISIAAPWGIA